MSIPAEAVRRACTLARWAPSAHNVQPWRVRQAHTRLEVLADPERHLPHGDPLGRDRALGLGAFTEALRLALTLEGIQAGEVEAQGGAFAALQLASAAQPERELTSLLRQRQTSRLRYADEPVALEALASLEARARAVGLRLHVVTPASAERALWRDWLFASLREAWLDGRAVRELRRWIRWDPEGAREPEDGLSTHALSLSTLEGLGFQALLRPTLWSALAACYLAPALASRLAEAERLTLEAPVWAVLIAAPGATLASGAGVLRFWLEATRQRLALHPFSTLIDRRGWELARSLGVSPAQLVLAFRLGHSAPPPRAGRRPVESFLE